MDYESELKYLLSLLDNFELGHTIISRDDEEMPELDGGLRRKITGDPMSRDELFNVLTNVRREEIYINEDEFGCTYALLRIDEEKFIIIGPFLEEPMTAAALNKFMTVSKIPEILYPQFEKHYSALPVVPTSVLLKLINPFAEALWETSDEIRVEFTSFQMRELDRDDFDSLAGEEGDAMIRVRTIEKIYEQENRLMQMVSRGQINRAVMLVDKQFAVEPRIPDKLRNQKNYMVIFNTLLRKAAEAGSVPAYQIDKTSSKYARRIEAASSLDELYRLQKAMVRGYCMLVNNYSMKDYSLLIRRALTYIDIDITGDLSLKKIASELSVNASYLSTLFKRETGCTLTEYVNRKRVEHAIFLLNTTNLQIQDIAESCGILDVNYFTKIFKKYTEQTPKEYRKTVHRF